MTGAGLLSGPGVGPWTLKVVHGILARRPPLGKGGPERVPEGLGVGLSWGFPGPVGGAWCGRPALDQAGYWPYGVTLTFLDRWPTPALLMAFTRYTYSTPVDTFVSE